MQLRKPLEIPCLTGIRFFAAFAILCHHSPASIFYYIPSAEWRHFFGQLGVFGMSLFFVMSGFIIHYNYFDKIAQFSWTNLYNFLVARFARLYPLFIFLVFTDIAIMQLNESFASGKLLSLPYFLTLSQTWFYHLIDGIPTFIPFSVANITWSISSEFLLYGFFPIMAYLLLKMQTKKRATMVFGLSIILQFLAIWLLIQNKQNIEQWALGFFGEKSVEANTPAVYSFYTWLSFNSPYIRFFEFAIGYGISNLLRAQGYTSMTYSKLITPVIFVFLLSLLLNPWLQWLPPSIVTTYLMTPTIGILLLYMTTSPSIVRSFFSIRSFVFLGEMSYSIYMVHNLVYVYFLPVPAQESALTYYLKADLKFAHACIVIFIISYFTYTYLEVPSRSFLRKRLSATIAPKEVIV